MKEEKKEGEGRESIETRARGGLRRITHGTRTIKHLGFALNRNERLPVISLRHCFLLHTSCTRGSVARRLERVGRQDR